MRLLPILILCNSFCIAATAQVVGEKTKTIPGSFVSFSIDNLDNIYLLTATNQLKKLNGNGDSIAVFNDVKKFGEATLVDVTNPLNVLLFYKDFSTIVSLDRMLAIRNTIDLRKHHIYKVSSIGLSYDGNIWLFDEVENTFKKMNDKGQLLLKTPDFRQLFDGAIAPQKIIDRDKYVYLYDSTQAVFKFDYYGMLKTKIPITHWKNIKIESNYIYGYDDKNFYKYNPASFGTDAMPIPFPPQKYRQYALHNGLLYALSNDGLDVYPLSL